MKICSLKKLDAIFKRVFDACASFLGLIAFAPLMMIVAMIIKLESPGPIFYRGRRSGRFNKVFYIFKFRTMVDNAEALGGPSTALDDRRLTRFGGFLRRHKIDELPQLINILLGEMSFVGPRPQVEEYTKLYNDEERHILSIRPGLTDYASTRFFNMDAVLGNGDVDHKYLTEIEPKKNKLRIKYVKERSLGVDFKILFRTFLQFFKIRKVWNIDD